MIRRIVLAPLVLLAGAALGLPGGTFASGASGSIAMMPHHVKIGTRAQIVGNHLPANKYFTLIMAVPDNRHPKLEQFIPVLPKTDSHGHFAAYFMMPIVPQCGKATLYANVVRHAQQVHSSFVITGCKASGKSSAPPPPPSKKPKKH